MSELPQSLFASAAASVAETAAKDETPQMKQARQRITACLIHKLWPTAKLQFGWDDKGAGHFELTFPNNAYRRASAVTLSRVYADKTGVTVGAFLWLPEKREFAMPPFIVVRADSEGRVDYYRAFVVDDEARVSEDRLPEWQKRDDDSFAFVYEGVYGSELRIEWAAVVDASAAELVGRIPQRIAIAGKEWTLANEGSDGASIVLRTELAGESRNIRVRCQPSSGANCIVGVDDLVAEMSFATK